MKIEKIGNNLYNHIICIHEKYLDSDWLRAVQLLCNSAQKYRFFEIYINNKMGFFQYMINK